METEGSHGALCGNRLSDRYIPQRESLLSSSMIKKAVFDLIKAEHSVTPTELGVHVRKFVGEFHTMAHGGCFLKTTKGYTGLVLQFVQPGDIICVLLGCNTPMILRPSSETKGAFEVVGAACVDGFTEAQTLLGPFPDYTSFVYQYREETKTFRAAYLDKRTHDITLNDPGLGRFLQDGGSSGIRKRTRMVFMRLRFQKIWIK